MMNGKRLLSLFLAVILVVSVLPPVQAEAAVTVYLDPANGADTNTGSESAPVKSLAAAYEKLSQGGGTVVFLSDLTWDTSAFFPACKYPVTLTSKTGAEGIVASANMRMQADTTFKNMTLTFNNTAMMMVSGEGHDLTIESDVKVVRTTTGQLNITPAGRYGSTLIASPTLTVKAGSWNYIYAVHGIGINGDVNVVVDGATCSYISPCYNATVTGNVNVTVKNSTVTNLYLEPTHTDGKITGNLNVTLADKAAVTKVTGSSGTVQGVATVELDGADQNIAEMTGYGTGSKLIFRFCNHRFGNAILAHHQGGIQSIGLGAESCPFFTCQHSQPPSSFHKTISVHLHGETLRSFPRETILPLSFPEEDSKK